MAFISAQRGDIKIHRRAVIVLAKELHSYSLSFLSHLVQASRLVELTEPFGCLARSELEPVKAGRERERETERYKECRNSWSITWPLKKQMRLNLIWCWYCYSVCIQMPQISIAVCGYMEFAIKTISLMLRIRYPLT